MSQNRVSDKRDNSLDAVAGLLMLVVIIGHANLTSKSEVGSLGYVFAFYMAWFFFKAGMFHRQISIDKHYVVKMVKRLMVPYLVFSVIGLFVDFFVGKACDRMIALNIYGYVSHMVYLGTDWSNVALWFLFSFFCVKIITAFFCHRYWIVWTVVSLICAYIHSVVFPEEKFTYLGNIPLGTAFYVIGYEIRQLQYKPQVAIIASVVALTIGVAYPSVIDLFSNKLLMGNYLVAVIWFVAMIITTDNLFRRISYLQLDVLKFIGKNSMLFLVAQVPVILAVRRIAVCYWSETVLSNWAEAIISIVVILSLYQLFKLCPRMKWAIGD
jgi:fucose 4-O-acetylase-like acetyltransferase